MSFSLVMADRAGTSGKRAPDASPGEPLAKLARGLDPAIVEMVPFGSGPDLGPRLAAALQHSGVVVVTGIMSVAEARGQVDNIVAQVRQLLPWLPENPSEWATYDLPPQTRSGLFQGLLAGVPAVWNVRASPAVSTVFSSVYSALRGKPAGPMFTSIDGINLRGARDRAHTERTADWAHLDQTRAGSTPATGVYSCVQGQVTAETHCVYFLNWSAGCSWRQASRRITVHRGVCVQSRIAPCVGFCTA